MLAMKYEKCMEMGLQVPYHNDSPEKMPAEPKNTSLRGQARGYSRLTWMPSGASVHFMKRLQAELGSSSDTPMAWRNETNIRMLCWVSYLTLGTFGSCMMSLSWCFRHSMRETNEKISPVPAQPQGPRNTGSFLSACFSSFALKTWTCPFTYSGRNLIIYLLR